MKGAFLLLFGVLFLTGCTTSSMKGTPFYTGEYEVREGPAADRVNLWPLLYYRDPALSVLWPLTEFSPDHLAVRPVYSIEDRSKDKPVYNVLWPLGRFDTAHRDYRFFPAYWGEDYFTAFPLYWHKGDPVSGVGYNSLFPLWIWNNKADGYSLDVLWPFCARHEYPDRQEWRVWPLRGSADKCGSHYCYTAWPLVHHWNTDTNQQGHAVAPLYLYSKEPARSLFLSLPYSRSWATEAGGKSWDLALPLCYRGWVGDRFSWMAFPALSWGTYDGQMSNNWYALGLGHSYASEERSSNHVIPLYYYGRDPYAQAFYTLPWWSKKYMDDSGWHTLVPFYYRSYSDDAAAFYSLPWWAKKYMDDSGWHTLVPFYYRSYSDDASAFYSLPWWSKKHADGAGWNATIPFYYRSRAAGASVFYSLPWLSEKHADGSGWKASFPFYFGSSSTNGSFMMTPLYARKQQADGSLDWHCFIPIVYLDETKDAHFMTLLGGRWGTDDQDNWLALPLLSGGAKDAESGRNIWLAGLAGQQWAGADKSHYILPFYYAAPNKGHFVSLPYAAWRKDDEQYRSIPILASGWYSGSERSGSFLVAGLAGNRRGGEDAYHYAIPFYFAAPDKGTFVSIPYAAWRTGDRQSHLIPLLLSGWYAAGKTSGACLLCGLVGNRRGGEGAYNYVIPFYYAAPDKGTFVSIPYAAWRTGEKQNHAIPLLLSGWSTEGDTSESLLLGGLGYWEKNGDQVRRSRVLPFYMFEKDEYFYTALYGKNRELEYYATPLAGRYGGDSGVSGSWVFPLYRHKRQSPEEVKGRYLLLGYCNKDERFSRYGFFGFYDYDRKKTYVDGEDGPHLSRESKIINYLFMFGQDNERWEYGTSAGTGTEQPSAYSKDHYLFPLWSRTVDEKTAAGTRLETSSLLGFLYDTRHEEQTGEKEHDYLRRRVLWRLYHREKLNGDASTDIFPGITVDSYKNGYYKCSVLWRLFCYEKDPETNNKKLDLLFIPLRR